MSPWGASGFGDAPQARQLGKTTMGYGSVTMAIDNDEAERVRAWLRTVLLPGSQRNIVAAGFVKDIEAVTATATLVAVAVTASI